MSRLFFILIAGLLCTPPVFADALDPDHVLSPPPKSSGPQGHVAKSPKAAKCYREGKEQSLSGPELELFEKSCMEN